MKIERETQEQKRLKCKAYNQVFQKAIRDVSADAQTNEIIEHPPFSTNIFDGRVSEPEPEPELLEPQVAHWFWFCTIIAIFCFGVASSYYIINA